MFLRYVYSKIIIILSIISGFNYCSCINGFSIELTNLGSGFYYKHGKILNNNSSYMLDLGLNLQKNNTIVDNYSILKYNSIYYLNFLPNYKINITKISFLRIFDPSVTFYTGLSTKLDKYLYKRWSRNSFFIYSLGFGFQFYNNRILNEISIKINELLSLKRNFSIKLSIYNYIRTK